jgi:hypothetical protein
LKASSAFSSEAGAPALPVLRRLMRMVFGMVVRTGG